MNDFAHKRTQILQQMEQIQTMERGSLQEERRPSKENPKFSNGPYFKHQVWENGQNQTRRVPQEKARALAQAIQGRKEFEALAQQFVKTTVAMTRAQQERPDSKKNATNSRRLSTRKPRA
jgi:outer membrane translocation and assembly module TamA